MENEAVQAHSFPSVKPLVLALIVVLVAMTAEIIGGILSNSLALISDAGHMLVDALALGLSLFAMTLARRPATLTRTFGFHRAEIMAAFINGSTLVLIAVFILYQAYQRFLAPPEIQTPIMLMVGIFGLLANLVELVLLTGGGGRRSLNIRAAIWHIVGDTVSSLGVIIGGMIIMVTGWFVADPVIAVVIAAIILWGAVRVVRESADILLESVPKDIQVERVVEAIKRIPGVEGVHEVHVWTITSALHALSAHLIVNDQQVSRSADIVEAVNRDLARNFNIRHTTLQLECQVCSSGCVCDVGEPEQK